MKGREEEWPSLLVLSMEMVWREMEPVLSNKILVTKLYIEWMLKLTNETSKKRSGRRLGD
jgi:hypothetical protein